MFRFGEGCRLVRDCPTTLLKYNIPVRQPRYSMNEWRWLVLVPEYSTPVCPNPVQVLSNVLWTLEYSRVPGKGESHENPSILTAHLLRDEDPASPLLRRVVATVFFLNRTGKGASHRRSASLPKFPLSNMHTVIFV